MTPPAFIGRYAIRRSLGSGGFATVWLGFDERLDDQVAIKVLAENWAQRLDVRDRFTQEARVLRRARSPHVVQVYDIDQLPDGRPYFVMTYADGGSLSDRLAHGPLPAETALGYGAVIATGVQDLHDSGVMHRDIKPSNVLFRSTSELLIADLGLARDLDRGSRLTLTAGTPGYMAPEQADGDATIDHRVDVYAIGATVYRALTGRTPTVGAVTPVGQVRPDLPLGTDAVLMRALATHPGDRWSTAGELAEELRRVVNGRASTAPLAVDPERTDEVVAPPSKSGRRRWWIAAAAVLATAAAVAGVLLAVNSADRPASALTPPETTTSSSSMAPAPPSPSPPTPSTAPPTTTLARATPPPSTTTTTTVPPAPTTQSPQPPSPLPSSQAEPRPQGCPAYRMCFYPENHYYGTPEVRHMDYSETSHCQPTAKPFKSVYNSADQNQQVWSTTACGVREQGPLVKAGQGFRYIEGRSFRHS
ncbi:serine/threonine protein kinase [Herbihabitans rhizosphaerae]|uniref:non-specific serine/threonine protein kinase n=1 Tax=Herbihabitans rhizosphaerae TaxID=1872711 RepID=A0A4Q7L5F4_9PSEU|nr:serine/threonine-protein kinase [Herbihabitans rhizosphaerae]RZS43771.1 serine/threonine protein kinase [Herbihabitans rhizosphaerae]